jgi:hypothetical protein
MAAAGIGAKAGAGGSLGRLLHSRPAGGMARRGGSERRRAGRWRRSSTWLRRTMSPLRRLARHRGERLTRRVLLAALLVGAAVVAWPARAGPRHAEILRAIRLVECGGRDPCPDGDGGLAIGPYQIHRVYWEDAVAHDPSLGPRRGFDYQDCRRREYAERVIEAYMRKWVPEAWRAGDAEVIARTHNGGPSGARLRSTAGYWARVQARLRG